MLVVACLVTCCPLSLHGPLAHVAWLPWVTQVEGGTVPATDHAALAPAPTTACLGGPPAAPPVAATTTTEPLPAAASGAPAALGPLVVHPPTHQVPCSLTVLATAACWQFVQLVHSLCCVLAAKGASPAQRAAVAGRLLQLFGAHAAHGLLPWLARNVPWLQQPKQQQGLTLEHIMDVLECGLGLKDTA